MSETTLTNTQSKMLLGLIDGPRIYRSPNPLLQTLERRGFVRSRPALSSFRDPKRKYSITPAGLVACGWHVEEQK